MWGGDLEKDKRRDSYFHSYSNVLSSFRAYLGGMPDRWPGSSVFFKACLKLLRVGQSGTHL